MTRNEERIMKLLIKIFEADEDTAKSLARQIDNMYQPYIGEILYRMRSAERKCKALKARTEVIEREYERVVKNWENLRTEYANAVAEEIKKWRQK